MTCYNIHIQIKHCQQYSDSHDLHLLHFEGQSPRLDPRLYPLSQGVSLIGIDP